MKRILFALLVLIMAVSFCYAGGQGEAKEEKVDLTVAFEGTASRRELL